MNNLDKQYQELLQDILNNGVEKETRNGKTLSVFGRQIRHKMSEGFPLITTKKMYWNGIITELLYFLRGETSIEYLIDNGCNIWNGDLSKHHNVNVNDYKELTKLDLNLYEGGAIYPHQWRNFGSNNYNRKRITEPFKTSFLTETPNLNSTDNNVGKMYDTLDYGSYIVLDSFKQGERNETYYKIQFNTTNTIKNIRKDKLGTNVSDPYKPSKNGIACMGDYKKYSHLNIDKLKNVWNGMISRCYNSSNDNYPYYGGKGVYVENRWLCFEYFLSDVSKIKNWDIKLNNWDEYNLDKDVYGDGFIYSLETCCWLSKSDNTKKSKEKYRYVITNGIEEYSFTNHVDFICKMGINNQGNFASMLRGERNICDGWSLINKEKITDGIDQINELIYTLKTNPDSRRMLVTAWNPSQLHDLCLPACHYGFQVYTRELSELERHDIKEQYGFDCRKLAKPSIKQLDDANIPTRAISLMWNQRSCDVPLGIPFNIASYGLLLEIIAKIVNMVPDELIGNLGDTHIYQNQIDGCKEQIERSSFELPKLNINTEFWLTKSGECGIGELSDNTDAIIKGMEITDFQIEGYQSHPTIKMPLSN
jgi:thymidylate synthase